MNSTPIVINGLVIVATNASMAAAYDQKSGERIWLRKLDGPSIYLLKPDTGKVIRRFTWKGDAISRADCTTLYMVCILREAGLQTETES